MKMGLDEYWKKRDFEKTVEPKGDKKMGSGDIYVIQKHDASHMHYDLRLEMDGVLKSWAVPKTPPAEKGVKRLAVQTEDHPVEYANFKGIILEGQYGAGTVEIWDKGKYVLEERTDDQLIFEIKGNKLRGVYCLLRFKGKENWLFFKKE